MKKLLRYTACLAILVMVIVLFTGCCETWPGKVTGGGWFINTACGNDDEKCTFGFNAQLKDNPGAVENEKEYTGQFQFRVIGKDGVTFHLSEITAFKWCGEDEIKFKGVTKDGVDVTVKVTDLGEPGVDAGDYIKIWYGSGFFPDWSGELMGGNIQVHYKD